MYRYQILLTQLLFLLLACEKSTSIVEIPTKISITYPEQIVASNVTNDSVSYTNLSTGHTFTVSADTEVALRVGLYQCSYCADAIYWVGDTRKEGVLKATLENVVITDDSYHLLFEPFLMIEKNDFIIEEIFFTGTLRNTGKQYYGDSYIKLFNNTDQVLYADGLAFVESKFSSTDRYDYDPDIRKDTMTVQAIYVIPGSGNEHPVNPGESILLCDTGIDHRAANSNSFDLTGADFEWYDISTSPAHMDIDSELVPNLDKWYSYTLSFFVLHNRGFRSYALARIPMDRETYMANYVYTYTYEIVVPAGTFPKQQTAHKIPNEWIVDGVNCSVQAEWEWNLLPATLDAGWTHCGTINHDATRYFKSVRRKLLYLDEDGKRVLKDTDNSSDDFNAECVPSVIELQHSAIRADGTKATQITYDGVIPVETVPNNDSSDKIQ